LENSGENPGVQKFDFSEGKIDPRRIGEGRSIDVVQGKNEVVGENIARTEKKAADVAAID